MNSRRHGTSRHGALTWLPRVTRQRANGGRYLGYRPEPQFRHTGWKRFRQGRMGTCFKDNAMQIQPGLKRDSQLTKHFLGIHPIIEQFIEQLQIREIIGTYVRVDRRMTLDHGKALTLLIHNILTTPQALYEMVRLDPTIRRRKGRPAPM